MIKKTQTNIDIFGSRYGSLFDDDVTVITDEDGDYEYWIANRNTKILEGVWRRRSGSTTLHRVIHDLPFMKRNHPFTIWTQGCMWVIGGFGAGEIALKDVWTSVDGENWNATRNINNCLSFVPLLYRGVLSESKTFVTAFNWEGYDYVVRDHGNVVSSKNKKDWCHSTIPRVISCQFNLPKPPEGWLIRKYIPVTNTQRALLRDYINGLLLMPSDRAYIKKQWQRHNRIWYVSKETKQSEFLRYIISHNYIHGIDWRQHTDHELNIAIGEAYSGSDMEAMIMLELGDFNEALADLDAQYKEIFVKHFEVLRDHFFDEVFEKYKNRHDQYWKTPEIGLYQFLRGTYRMSSTNLTCTAKYHDVVISTNYRWLFERSDLKKKLDDRLRNSHDCKQ